MGIQRRGFCAWVTAAAAIAVRPMSASSTPAVSEPLSDSTRQECLAILREQRELKRLHRAAPVLRTIVVRETSTKTVTKYGVTYIRRAESGVITETYDCVWGGDPPPKRPSIENSLGRLLKR